MEKDNVVDREEKEDLHRVKPVRDSVSSPIKEEHKKKMRRMGAIPNKYQKTSSSCAPFVLLIEKGLRESSHCPKCFSEDLRYRIDIFKKGKDRYTGDCYCSDCKLEFKRKEIVFRYWIDKSVVVDCLKELEKVSFDAIPVGGTTKGKSVLWFDVKSILGEVEG